MQSATANIEDIYELSPLQQGMLFHSLYAPGTGVYFEQVVYHMAGGLNLQAFDAAWQALATAHPILRTSFFWDDLAKPLQVVHRRVRVPVEQHDWTEVSEEERKSRLDDYLRVDGELGFNIAEPPLLRVACFASPRATDVLLSFHHALLDGWSLQLLMKDLAAAYESQCWGRPARPPFRRPYTDYIGWLQAQDIGTAEQYWRNTLKDFRTPTPLNIDTLPATTDRTAPHGEVESWLPAETTRKLEEFARGCQITMNTLMQGAWALLLSRYSGESDVVFGSVVSGRPADLSGSDQMIGLFINTLPVRVEVSEDRSVVQWLKCVQESAARARAFEFSSLAQVQAWSEVPRDVPLLESVLVFENYPQIGNNGSSTGGTSARHIERTNLPLTLLIVPGQQLRTRILFDARKFDHTTVQRVLPHFEQILKDIANAPETVSSIRITTSGEVHEVAHAWNDAQCHKEAPWAIVQAFEDITGQMEHATALTGAREVTFGELNRLANGLAWRLMDAGVQRQSRVAVCLGRSVESAAALLAVLKLNAVYVPMDPAAPVAALQQLAAAADTRIVIAGRDLAVSFEDVSITPVIVEDARLDSADLSSLNPNLPPASPEDLMYIVFTSGSTGTPKGIAVEHRQVLNRLDWMWNEYPFESGEVACFKTSPSFVDHLWELLGGLLRGVPTLVVADEVARNPEALIETLAAGQVSRLWLVPSLLRSMLIFDGLRQRLPRLHFWVSSGEALSTEVFERFGELMPGARLYNLYGTSEVWDATWFDPVRERQPYCGQIGRPIRNMRAYVLLRNGEPAPIGVPGELCIGGAGVARGYLGQQAASDCFVADPFTQGRMYRTGDVCRFLPDGNIQFLGRRDHQVKLRGQRIELTHVESILDECPGVLHSAVVVRNGDGAAARMVAYVAPVPGIQLDGTRLRGYARERLPSSMRPSGYIVIDRVPLTASGKVDRLHLPSGYFGDELVGADSRPPQTPTEERLAALFTEVLGVSRFGVVDNFFTELGGNSLLATQLVSRIRDAFSIDLPLRQFFETPTIEQIASNIDRTGSPGGKSAPAIKRQPRASSGANSDIRVST